MRRKEGMKERREGCLPSVVAHVQLCTIMPFLGVALNAVQDRGQQRREMFLKTQGLGNGLPHI